MARPLRAFVVQNPCSHLARFASLPSNGFRGSNDCFWARFFAPFVLFVANSLHFRFQFRRPRGPLVQCSHGLAPVFHPKNYETNPKPNLTTTMKPTTPTPGTFPRPPKTNHTRPSLISAFCLPARRVPSRGASSPNLPIQQSIHFPEFCTGSWKTHCARRLKLLLLAHIHHPI